MALEPTPAASPSTTATDNPATRKAALRQRIRAARRLTPASTRDLTSNLLQLLDQLTDGVPTTVACYLAARSEPQTRSFITRAQAAGHRVLLPQVRGDGGLDWADAAGAGARDSGFGVPEADAVALPEGALRQASVIVVPALAASSTGARLGQGGGFYDRTLADRALTAPVVAAVFDDEVIADLPIEAHDRPTDWIVTERRIIATVSPTPIQ
ncbi:5-formyltetrahydrofolate cyclo-ligase [Pseudoclavibacter sp. 13-3]|uniref:5-formyltetrahydrofolate cyclo-ligase n=1 Tax=Pseudoclavibacter sp. 13-3 TaxID=2901228 RepID=UPI001E35A949|nr:5-formyltetrahydrofolate cyclo-ligase [Pseudoclavibacter sp. 13-3]MCD7101790.1 5-formyltetrahydrofolate cyclo-ligase [Pseudoclavibacter sp. 13-3]